MKKVKFVFGIHNHQPIGNFDFVFEDAYKKSYLPFLEVLEKHPKIKISLHFTGILLDWLTENHPELLDLVKKLRKRGQLELMSGAYYEPIISVIPHKDRLGQIKKLTNRVKELFDYDASGMWLAERIWEPTLPSSLSEAGIKYTVVDDTHFKYTGLKEEDLDGFFVTEDLGEEVFIFPISKKLRYTIPFQDPEETLKVLKKVASDQGDKVIVFADDGEKFGVWPDTYSHVYENKWLDRFFTAIEENLDWIELKTFDEVIKEVTPKGNIYLPTASYAEMMHWSLFKDMFQKYEEFEHYLQEQKMYDDVGVFVRGGFWRNFMTKYPEINIMHKKMLRVSEKLWKAKEKGFISDQAFDALWAGQCNCPYWHGVFGGLYLSHLRYAIFSNLIQAEKIISEKFPQALVPIEVSDFDRDGKKEILIETPLHDAYFAPGKGGILFEYDFKAANKNILDTMTRREEGYHAKLKHAKLPGESQSESAASIHDIVLAKEPGLEKYLIYDDYEKKSFVDHIWAPDTNFDSVRTGKMHSLSDFYKGNYNIDSTDDKVDFLEVVLSREGFIGAYKNPLRITKTIRVFKKVETIEVEYLLENKSKSESEFKFAVECNFGMQAGHADDRYYHLNGKKIENGFLDSLGQHKDINSIGIRDEYLKIDAHLEGEKTDLIWRMPVETISLSEAGFERVYQSSAVYLIWNCNLKGAIKLKVTQKVKPIK